MTAAVNGEYLPPPDPAEQVARARYTADFADGDVPWVDLPDDEREALIDLCREYMESHARWLTANGFRIVPPGAAPVPTTEADAMAMLQASKAFFDAQKRRGKLVSEGPRPKLIVPGRAH